MSPAAAAALLYEKGISKDTNTHQKSPTKMTHRLSFFPFFGLSPVAPAVQEGMSKETNVHQKRLSNRPTDSLFFFCGSVFRGGEGMSRIWYVKKDIYIHKDLQKRPKDLQKRRTDCLF